MEILRQALSSQNTEAWIQGLEFGDEEPIIATLIVPLTNFRTLELERIGDGIYEPQRFFDTLKFISAARDMSAFSHFSASNFFILGRFHEKILW